MTKKLKKKWLLCAILSVLSYIGTAAFLTIFALITLGGGAEAETANLLSEETSNVLMSLAITTVIGLVAAIIIKNRLRTAIWMASTVMAAILFGSVGMYIVLGIWFTDEYVLTALSKHYHNRYIINKEIDARGTSE